jgi:hypothetical protein
MVIITIYMGIVKNILKKSVAESRVGLFSYIFFLFLGLKRGKKGCFHGANFYLLQLMKIGP